MSALSETGPTPQPGEREENGSCSAYPPSGWCFSGTYLLLAYPSSRVLGVLHRLRPQHTLRWGHTMWSTPPDNEMKRTKPAIARIAGSPLISVFVRSTAMLGG